MFICDIIYSIGDWERGEEIEYKGFRGGRISIKGLVKGGGGVEKGEMWKARCFGESFDGMG